MKHLRILTGVGLSAVFFAGSLGPVFAQTTAGTPTGKAGTPVTQSISGGLDSSAYAAGYSVGAAAAPLQQVIGGLISAALGLLGVILLAYILYGGFLWMTAGGETKKVDEARNIIKNAIIGLAIIVAAYAIASFVLTQLSGALGASTAGGGAKVCPAGVTSC